MNDQIIYAIETSGISEALSAMAAYAKAIGAEQCTDGSFAAGDVVVDWSREDGWSDKTEIEFAGRAVDVERVFADFRHYAGIIRNPQTGAYDVVEERVLFESAESRSC